MAAELEYHKPTELSEALSLLGRASPVTVPLAGGTWLVPRIGNPISAEAVVDLSALDLDQIERDPDTLRIGAMTTLTQLADSAICRHVADGIMNLTGKRDAAVNVRNAATVGGTVVVCPPDSELVLALLALGAELSQHRADGVKTVSLAEFTKLPLHQRCRGLVTQVRLHLPLHSAGGLARIARTPSDHPIVAAAAVIAEDQDYIRIAVGGVGPLPIVITFRELDDFDEAVSAALQLVELHQDFRGSAEYRLSMGPLLARRALKSAIASLRQN